MEKTYSSFFLLTITIMLVLVLVVVVARSYNLRTTLAQTSLPPTKMNLTNATSMNTTKSTGNITNVTMNSS